MQTPPKTSILNRKRLAKKALPQDSKKTQNPKGSACMPGHQELTRVGRHLACQEQALPQAHKNATRAQLNMGTMSGTNRLKRRMRWKGSKGQATQAWCIPRKHKEQQGCKWLSKQAAHLSCEKEETKGQSAGSDHPSRTPETS